MLHSEEMFFNVRIYIFFYCLYIELRYWINLLPLPSECSAALIWPTSFLILILAQHSELCWLTGTANASDSTDRRWCWQASSDKPQCPGRGPWWSSAWWTDFFFLFFPNSLSPDRIFCTQGCTVRKENMWLGGLGSAPSNKLWTNGV